MAVAAPLVACGGAVHVSGLAAGDWVEVLSAGLGAPIASGLATGTDMDIPVSPLLIAGDEITARVTGCTTAQSAPVKVGPEPKALKPPIVETPTEGDTSIKVIDIEPGALVDVFVNEVYRSGAFCGAASASISVVTPLALNDKVKARQRICAVTSAFSAEVNTLPPLPVAGIKVLTPSSGLTPAARPVRRRLHGRGDRPLGMGLDRPQQPADQLLRRARTRRSRPLPPWASGW